VCRDAEPHFRILRENNGAGDWSWNFILQAPSARDRLRLGKSRGRDPGDPDYIHV